MIFLLLQKMVTLISIMYMKLTQLMTVSIPHLVYLQVMVKKLQLHQRQVLSLQ